MMRFFSSKAEVKSRLAVRFWCVSLVVVWTCSIVLSPVEAQQYDLASNDVSVLRMTGDPAGGQAGESVASGDLNADGYDDIIIGAYRSSVAGRNLVGKVYVVFGGPSFTTPVDLSTEADLVITGEAGSDLFGISVASGNLNGDLYEDIIIGANFSDPNGRVNAGKVYVFFGGQGLSGAIDLGDGATNADLEIYGARTGDFLGWTVASGDINGDGTDDLLIGAIGVDVVAGTEVLGAGATYVFYGGADLQGILDLNDANFPADVALQGKKPNDTSGISLAFGYIDDDVYGDIIIGASAADPNGNNSGEVYVVYGSASLDSVISLENADLTILGAAEGDVLGTAFSSGDFNRDGRGDLLLGARSADPAGLDAAGIAYMIYSASELPEIVNLKTFDVDVVIPGNSAGVNVGFSVLSVNLNGDGFDDFIASAPLASPLGRINAGEVYGLYGDPSLPSSIDLGAAALKVLGAVEGIRTGFDVASGDINNDGVEDLIIGAPELLSATPGEVYVIFGVPPRLDISVASTSATYNEPISLSVNIDYNSGMMVMEADMYIAYDTTLLTFDNIQKGTLIPAWSVGYTLAQGIDIQVDTLKVYATNPGSPLLETGAFMQLDFIVNNVRRAMTGTLVFEVLSFNGGRTEWNEITQPVITLTGNDGTLASSVVSEPGDTLRVRVSDVDLNADSATEDAVLVQLRNGRTGEVEMVRLAEQGTDSEVFFGEALTALGAAGDPDDGVMNAQAGDTLSFTYTDSLSETGPEVARVENHWVLTLGDADGNGETQAFDASYILGHALEQLTLTGVDSLAANVDALAPYGEITSYDAALVIQRRLGLIDRFPVQATTSDNHPQPGGQGAGKPVPEERLLTLIPDGEQIVVWAAEREGIVAADLVAEGMEGMVEMAPELARFQTAVRNVGGDLRIAFAGDQGVRGAGELFRIIPTGESRAVRGLRGHFNGGRMVARAAVQAAGKPLHLTLHPNTPNPFNPETLIRVDLPADQEMRLEVFNTLGQKVRTLAAGRVEAGSHQFNWDSRDEQGQPVASGIYLYRLTAGQRMQTRSMMLLK